MIRVLIVEDEEVIRKGLIYSINWLSLGAVIVGDAKNGEEGLEAIEKLQPDLVIADIKMPKMDGLEMLSRAKERGRGAKFESIILTSHQDFDFAKRSIDLKVQDYMLKPISESKLKNIMDFVKEKMEEKETTKQITEVAKITEELLDAKKLAKVGKKNQNMEYIIDRVKESFQDKLSIENIAKELEVSASYLSRSFKKEMGTTFLEFLNKYRIIVSIDLLKSGNYKVYEVSDMVGFLEYKHYFTIFKKYTGLSPRSFLG